VLLFESSQKKPSNTKRPKGKQYCQGNICAWYSRQIFIRDRELKPRTPSTLFSTFAAVITLLAIYNTTMSFPRYPYFLPRCSDRISPHPDQDQGCPRNTKQAVNQQRGMGFYEPHQPSTVKRFTCFPPRLRPSSSYIMCERGRCWCGGAKRLTPPPNTRCSFTLAPTEGTLLFCLCLWSRGISYPPSWRIQFGNPGGV